MTPKQKAVLAAAVLFWAVIATSVSAGQFQIERVYYPEPFDNGGASVQVLVGAWAKYIGTVDDEGSDWAMWTELSVIGKQSVFGRTYSKDGSTFQYYENMVITLDPYTHGASDAVAKCTEFGYNSAYVGYGYVVIPHWGVMGDADEFHDGSGKFEETECESTEETPPPTEPDGGSEPAPGDGTQNGPEYGTPILIDLDRGNFRLTDLANGVHFDLNRDGVAESLSWTEPGSGDAWLALDRNGNGAIDDGGELFGDYTDQPTSEAPHGYLALQVFDEDGDGFIGSTDSVYSDLLLWIDGDQNGTSSPSELTDLATAGVEWIHLATVESRSRDRHGNEFRYKSHVRTRRGMTKSVDVFLLTGP